MKISKPRRSWRRGKGPLCRAFTLLELLFVTVIIVILAAVLLPVVQRAKGKSRQIECLSQLRQVGIAYLTFAHDHLSRFPFQTPIREGGTLEMVQGATGLPDVQYAFRHYQALSNDLAALGLLVCPSDTRTNASSFSSLRNVNISYFVAVSADPGRPDAILGGDRNFVLREVGSVGSVLRIPPWAKVAWTRAGHEYRGNLLFADGHVERVGNVGLQSAFQGSAIPVSAWMPVGGSGSGAAGAGSTGAGQSSSGGNAPGAGGAGGQSGFAVLQNVFNNAPSSPPNSTPASAAPAPARDPRDRGLPAPIPAVELPQLAGAAPGAPQVKTNAAAPMAPPASTVRVSDPEPESDPWMDLLEPDKRSWWWWLLVLACVGIAILLGWRIQRVRQAGRTG